MPTLACIPECGMSTVIPWRLAGYWFCYSLNRQLIADVNDRYRPDECPVAMLFAREAVVKSSLGQTTCMGAVSREWVVHSIDGEALQLHLVAQLKPQVLIQRHIVGVFGIKAQHALAIPVVVQNGGDQ